MDWRLLIELGADGIKYDGLAYLAYSSALLDQ